MYDTTQLGAPEKAFQNTYMCNKRTVLQYGNYQVF